METVEINQNNMLVTDSSVTSYLIRCVNIKDEGSWVSHYRADASWQWMSSDVVTPSLRKTTEYNKEHISMQFSYVCWVKDKTDACCMELLVTFTMITTHSSWA